MQRLVMTAIGLIWALTSYAAAPDASVRESLFNAADQAIAAADGAHAEVLSPTNYSRAMGHYRDAEKDFAKNGSLEGIRRDLDDAIIGFSRAVESSKLAEFTLTAAIQARNDAISAESSVNAAKLWAVADQEFERAATRLEGGDVKRAKRYADKAETQFRAAELTAIKVSYLEETRTLLAQAEREDVDRYAPQTLQRAFDLLAKAEHELNTNRYDTDYPRDLARQAKYEARHALYIASVGRQVRGKDLTVEQLILSGETALNVPAAMLDVQASFDAGYAPAAKMIATALQLVQDTATSNGQENQQLKLENAQLREELGGTSERVKAQERRREQLRAVESYFTSGEARVLREGNDVILRMVGLNFESGKAVIEPRYFALLRRVQEAIAQFPGARIEVQGHTDAYGSDALNLELSQQRADAVRAYLLANTSLQPEVVAAVGVGETRPIANNETAEGRAKNRRIDIIITP